MNPAIARTLVQEVAVVREDQRDIALVDRRDQAVGEREETVAGARRALSKFAGPLAGNPYRTHPVRLPSTDAARNNIPHNRHAVGLHVAHDVPSKDQVTPLGGGRPAL